MGGVKVGAISSGMPSTEEFVGRILHELYCTLFIAFSKKLLRLFVDVCARDVHVVIHAFFTSCVMCPVPSHFR